MNILTVNAGSSSVSLDIFEGQAGGIRNLTSETLRPEEGTLQKYMKHFLAGHD